MRFLRKKIGRERVKNKMPKKLDICKACRTKVPIGPFFAFVLRFSGLSRYKITKHAITRKVIPQNHRWKPLCGHGGEFTAEANNNKELVTN